jgi:hypothetical protein
VRIKKELNLVCGQFCQRTTVHSPPPIGNGNKGGAKGCGPWSVIFFVNGPLSIVDSRFNFLVLVAVDSRLYFFWQQSMVHRPPPIENKDKRGDKDNYFIPN